MKEREGDQFGQHRLQPAGFNYPLPDPNGHGWLRVVHPPGFQARAVKVMPQ